MAIFSLLIFSSRVGNIEFNDLVCLLCTFNLLCCVYCSLDQHFRVKVSTYGYLDEIRLNFPAFNIFIKNNCRVHSISSKLTLHIKHSKIPTRRIDARLRCSTFFLKKLQFYALYQPLIVNVLIKVAWRGGHFRGSN